MRLYQACPDTIPGRVMFQRLTHAAVSEPNIRLLFDCKQIDSLRLFPRPNLQASAHSRLGGFLPEFSGIHRIVSDKGRR